MKKQYLSEIIDDEEINSWKARESILITSPTGSGKSHFVLNKLLPRAIKEGKHILYLCNRKILSEQITVTSHNQLVEFFGECEDLSEEQMNAIHIVTYQHCEQKKGFPRVSNSQITLDEYNILYYVFDEAHYFLSDALFNSGTHMWLDRLPTKGINVFLTATPEPLQWFFAATNSFEFIKHIRSIREGYIKQTKRRKELKKNQYIDATFVDMANGTPSRAIHKNYTEREIADECRKIEVYSEVFKDIQKLIAGETERSKVLPKKPGELPYSQMKEFYFQDYSDIEERIIKHSEKEKWLIFVDIEEDGIKLSERLNTLGVRTVFLSAKTIHRQGAGKAEFKNIVQMQKFSSPVLIATSVMDCGVNIVDPTVKHVVLSQCEKTTFLQMLGRRRMQDWEQIELYIKPYLVRQILGRRHQLETQMRTLVNFALRNDVDYIKKGAATEWSDGMKEIPRLREGEKNRALEQIFVPRNLALTYDTAQEKYASRSTTCKQLILEEREYSKTAFLALLYGLFNYIEALDDYRKTKDPLFYLKRQLSWIGKEYDERRWVYYDDAQEAVLNHLSSYCGKWMEKEEQRTFSAQCLKLLLGFPVLLQSIKNFASRYCKTSGNLEKGPGLNVLNRALEEKGLPYKIKSKQRYLHGGGRATFWCVAKIDD